MQSLMLQNKECNGKPPHKSKLSLLMSKNNKPNMMPWKNRSFKSEIETFKLLINCKNMPTNIQILNLKRNKKSLNSFKLNSKVKLSHKLKRKLQLSKKEEEKRKLTTNLHLKFHKLLSLKLLKKYLLQWHLNQKRFKRKNKPNLEKLKIKLKKQSKLKNLLSRKKKSQQKNKSLRLKHQKKNNL